MRNRIFACAVGVYLSTLIVNGQAALSPPSLQSPPPPLLSSPRAVIDQYCVGCHNQKAKSGGLMLDQMDLAQVGEHAEVWEKVVRKLRAGMMPPPGMPRPSATAYEALTVALEDELDRAAATKPRLTAAGVHRLNRTEYANAIRDLLALDIDPAAFLPADDTSYGFDNVVSGLQVSPALVEGYVSAASKISRLALGHETGPSRKVYHVREDYSQEDHVEGLPFGTRGGMLIHHYFPGRRRVHHLVAAGADHGRLFVRRRQRRRAARTHPRRRAAEVVQDRQRCAADLPARQE